MNKDSSAITVPTGTVIATEGISKRGVRRVGGPGPKHQPVIGTKPILADEKIQTPSSPAPTVASAGPTAMEEEELAASIKVLWAKEGKRGARVP